MEDDERRPRSVRSVRCVIGLATEGQLLAGRARAIVNGDDAKQIVGLDETADLLTGQQDGHGRPILRKSRSSLLVQGMDLLHIRLNTTQCIPGTTGLEAMTCHRTMARLTITLKSFVSSSRGCVRTQKAEWPCAQHHVAVRRSSRLHSWRSMGADEQELRCASAWEVVE